MTGDIKIFLILGICSLAAFMLLRVAFGKNEWDRPQLLVYMGVVLVALFAKNAYILFAFLFIVRVVYLKNDLQKNLLFFVFLFPLMPVNVVQPFLSPGTAYFIDLNWQRILALFLLVPLLPKIREMAQDKPGFYKLDLVFISLALIFLVSFFRENSVYQVTLFSSIRSSIGFILDVVVPYFVVSRALQSFTQLTLFARSIVLSGVVIAFSGIVEAGLMWKFYFHLGQGVSSYLSSALESFYEFRGGILRVSSSMGHPITFGLYMTIVMGFALFLLVHYRTSFLVRMAFIGLLLVAIFFTGSRGAWLGGAFLLVSYIFYSFSRGLRKLLVIQLVVGAIILGLMQWGPGGGARDQSLDSIDQHGTFVYRARLLEASLKVIPDNFWWGSRTFREHPEMQKMIQGQGIIDMVNGYLGIAVEYGMITFFLFMIMLIRVLTVGGKWVSLGDDYQYDAYRYLGAALITIMLSFALQFAFTSFVGFVHSYLWLLFAFAKGFNYVYSDTLDEIDANNGEVPEYEEEAPVAPIKVS